jgi:hypothetical protein
MARVVGYVFRSEDLPEEALESVGSGVEVVGQTGRLCERGNGDLGEVGEAVMGLVLQDQCYVLMIPEGEFCLSVCLSVSLSVCPSDCMRAAG